MAAVVDATERALRAWHVLEGVLDPEVPVVSVVDLGIVREVIEQGVRAALAAAGFEDVDVRLRRAPAWTTDWISADGRRKLREYGIAPPGPVAPEQGAPIRFLRKTPALACPRCESGNTERLSAFGSTACKATYRCRACGEPFEHFKAI